MDVKKLREGSGLTQDELAEVTKIPRDRIAKWEQGRGRPKADDFLVLDKFFKELVPTKKESKPINGSLPVDVEIKLSDYIGLLKEKAVKAEQREQDIQRILEKTLIGIDSNLNTALGGIVKLSLHVESVRAVALKSLARLEKKPEKSLIQEADNIVEQRIVNNKIQGT